MNPWLKTQALRDWPTIWDRHGQTICNFTHGSQTPNARKLMFAPKPPPPKIRISKIKHQTGGIWKVEGHLHEIISMCIYVNRIIQLYVHEHIYAIMCIYIYFIFVQYIYICIFVYIIYQQFNIQFSNNSNLLPAPYINLHTAFTKGSDHLRCTKTRRHLNVSTKVFLLKA